MNKIRLLTPELEKAIKEYPLYSQDGLYGEAKCIAVFALAQIRWFIIEGEKDGDDVRLFGVVVGMCEDEYGYISLNELSGIEVDRTDRGFDILKVRQQENWKPTPLKKILDPRLQRFLAKFQKEEMAG